MSGIAFQWNIITVGYLQFTNGLFQIACSSNHHHHHQFNTHECSMNNKIHEKAHTIIQRESTKKIQKDE